MRTELFDLNNYTVDEYTIKNDYLEASFINIGACITKLTDLKTGIDIIVGHKNYLNYLSNPGYMGSIVGRNAGRIGNALITIDGNTYPLTQNMEGGHQLHGGNNAFTFKYFTAKETEDSVIFIAESPDGEDGFPGEITLSVTYKLIANELHIIYDAKTTKKTLLNFTNHAYFNLNGTGDILSHRLKVNADYYLELTKEMIPVKKVPVQGTPLDFTREKIIGGDIAQPFEQLTIAGGFDHPFLVNKLSLVNQVAVLTGEKLTLEVRSDQDAVVLYTGNFIDESFQLKPVEAAKRAALCLETQGVPNSGQIEGYKDCNIFSPGNAYLQHTAWIITQNQ